MSAGFFLIVVIVVVIVVWTLKKGSGTKASDATAEPLEKPEQEPAPELEQKSNSESEPEPEPKPEPKQEPEQEKAPQVASLTEWPEEIAERVQSLAAEQDALTRHRIFTQLTELTYKNRKQPLMRDACKTLSAQHIEAFADIVEPLKDSNGGKLPQVMTFQNYANLLLEDQQFDEAVSVCEKALEFGLDDKTQTGFNGRIERIRAKQQKANSGA
ncbi:hypothetical protein [Aliidiomarina celeris]|uniref:hypothetical protein n=1 Tax=Aliidiomarina celeris TaxID=2249428 RepID=UPI000DEA2931|nr:hypothetical protein [Aliidiomarina celeris]